jgi:hypothetical protein
MEPKSLEAVQVQVDKATKEEIMSMLANVISWEVNFNDPAQMRRKIDAQGYLNGALFKNDIERARAFLHKISEQAAARGGFSNV